MSDEMSKRIGEAKDDREQCELRSEKKWETHIENHRIDDSRKLTSKHFVWGIVFVSIFQTVVAVGLHFVG